MNNAQWITLLLIFTILPTVVYFIRKNRRHGIVLEKKYKKSSRFMAFQYLVSTIDDDGKIIEVETPVMMTEYSINDEIKF